MHSIIEPEPGEPLTTIEAPRGDQDPPIDSDVNQQSSVGSSQNISAAQSVTTEDAGAGVASVTTAKKTVPNLVDTTRAVTTKTEKEARDRADGRSPIKSGLYSLGSGVVVERSEGRVVFSAKEADVYLRLFRLLDVQGCSNVSGGKMTKMEWIFIK